jgi:hypothetical protein
MTTPEQKAKAIELIKAGRSYGAVGRQVGITRSAVSGLARRSGLSTPSPHLLAARIWTPEKIDQLRQERGKGASYRDLARLLGVSPKSIERAVGRHMPDLRPPKSRVGRPRKTEHRQAPNPRPATPPKIHQPEPIGPYISLMMLSDKTCRWPHGDSPYLFCGALVMPGEVYCQHHCERAYHPHSALISRQRQAEKVAV